jgi:hypothetical protein
MKGMYIKLVTASMVGCALFIASGASAQTATATAGVTYTRSSSIRLGAQGRFNAINVVGYQTLGLDETPNTLVPIITPGVRFLNDRLFLGMGFGFVGGSVDNGTASSSRSAVSFSPLAFYDVISEPNAAFSLGGWFNVASLGDSERCAGDTCSDNDDGVLGWGLNLAAGLRGKISPALAIGGEFGWGFISASDGADIFYHGIFGNILFEASVGL